MPRPKIEHRSASKVEYEKFCQTHKDINITFEQYTSIIYTWNEYYMTHILETGDKIKMPYGFGWLSINKKITRRYFEKDGKKHCILPIDWPKTKEHGRFIYIFNDHTDGYRYKWFWFMTEARIKFAEIWYFKPNRKYSQLLYKYLTVRKEKAYKDLYREWYKGKSR